MSTVLRTCSSGAADMTLLLQFDNESKQSARLLDFHLCRENPAWHWENAHANCSFVFVRQRTFRSFSHHESTGLAYHFAETGHSFEDYAPLHARDADRCGTEGQGLPDDDPKYNYSVGISSGMNINAHLDFGVLSVMCTEVVVNSTTKHLQDSSRSLPTA